MGVRRNRLSISGCRARWNLRRRSQRNHGIGRVGELCLLLDVLLVLGIAAALFSFALLCKGNFGLVKRKGKEDWTVTCRRMLQLDMLAGALGAFDIAKAISCLALHGRHDLRGGGVRGGGGRLADESAAAAGDGVVELHVEGIVQLRC